MAWLKSKTASLARLRQLSWPEIWSLLLALFLLPGTVVAMALLGFRRCHLLLARLAAEPPTPSEVGLECKLQQGRQLTRLVRAAACHGFYSATCLPQSLTLWWLLRRRGIASDLRIGVRKHSNDLDAHAWVELAGIVLNDSMDVHQRFAPFEGAIVPCEGGQPR